MIIIIHRIRRIKVFEFAIFPFSPCLDVFFSSLNDSDILDVNIYFFSYFIFMSFHSLSAVNFTGSRGTLSHCFSFSSCAFTRTDTITDYGMHGVFQVTGLFSSFLTRKWQNDERCGFYGLNFVLCSYFTLYICTHGSVRPFSSEHIKCNLLPSDFAPKQHFSTTSTISLNFKESFFALAHCFRSFVRSLM